MNLNNNAQEPKGFIEMLEDILIEKYGHKIVELGREPHNYHPIDDADAFASHTGPCGDTMKIWLKINGNTIEDIGFRTDGCDFTRSVGSILTDFAKGKEIQEALQITPLQIDDALGGLPDDHKHCAILAKDALHKAIENYNKNSNSKSIG